MPSALRSGKLLRLRVAFNSLRTDLSTPCEFPPRHPCRKLKHVTATLERETDFRARPWQTLTQLLPKAGDHARRSSRASISTSQHRWLICKPGRFGSVRRPLESTCLRAAAPRAFEPAPPPVVPTLSFFRAIQLLRNDRLSSFFRLGHHFLQGIGQYGFAMSGRRVLAQQRVTARFQQIAARMGFRHGEVSALKSTPMKP